MTEKKEQQPGSVNFVCPLDVGFLASDPNCLPEAARYFGYELIVEELPIRNSQREEEADVKREAPILPFP